MNVSGKVSYMSLCSNKGLQRECQGLGSIEILAFFFFFKQRIVKTGPKANI